MVELIPDSYTSRLNLSGIFGRAAALQVDLGCGDGSFLCELAARFPDKNFLGIERLTGRVAKTARRAAEIGNVRVLYAETAYAVRYLLPECSIEVFYLSFPDPWPKRRHHRRRTFTLKFLDSIHVALEENGIFRIATDHRDYFEHITKVSGNHSGFLVVDANDVAQRDLLKLDCFKQSSWQEAGIVESDDWVLPPTKFEKRFRAQGAAIYRLALRKVSPVI